MVNEILLRISHPKWEALRSDIAEIIESNLKVTFVDNALIQKQVCVAAQCHMRVVSISKGLSRPLFGRNTDYQYFAISRVFSIVGEPLGWYIPSISNLLIGLQTDLSAITNGPGLVVDTDMSTGSTRKIAMALFPKFDFFAPIELQKNQDLIDVEDLVENNTYLYRNEKIVPGNYMTNVDFFMKRTSLKENHYRAIKNAVEKVNQKFQENRTF